LTYFKTIRLLAGHDLKLALKERSTLMWLFLMPPIFFYFIGTVTQGGVNIISDRSVGLVVENKDQAFLGEHLEARLRQNLFTITRPQDLELVAEGEKAPKVRKLTIPTNFTRDILAKQQVTLSFEGFSAGFSNDYDLIRIQKAAYTVLGDIIVATSNLEEGEALDAGAVRPFVSATRPTGLNVKPAGRRREIPSGFDQAIPGTLVMFTLLVLLTSGASMLVDERKKQLLRRLASTPFSRNQIVAGKWAGRMALAMVQIGFALLLGSFAFKMDWGSSLPMVLAILFAWGALCTSLALLLGSLAKSAGQAAGLGIFSTMVLAALGGCWWPIEIAPAWMQTLQLFTPTG